MRQNRPTASVTFLCEHLSNQIVQYVAALPKLALREKVLQLIELQETFRKLGKSVVIDAGFSRTSARARIRKYFEDHIGEIIEGDELAIVSGISEYARRVRELRDEGLEILTGPDLDPQTRHPLRPDQYLVASHKGSVRSKKKPASDRRP